VSAALLIAALIAGKVGLAALTAADWTILAQAGFTAARIVILIGAKVERDVAAHRQAPRNLPKLSEATPAPILCFRGAPSAQAARFC